MAELSSPGQRVTELRELFDSAFSEPPPAEGPQVDDLLAVRTGGDPYALRLAEVAGLVAAPAITRLPDPSPGLVGLTSFRGTIVVVYDLGVLLGQPGGGAPHWLALAAADPTLGLAFEDFEMHLRVPREAIAATDGTRGRPTRPHELVLAAGVTRPIVPVTSIIDEIRRRVRPGPEQSSNQQREQ